MTTQRENSISIIIPTLNEEHNIEILLKHIQKYFQSCQVIVVDGGSSDKTVTHSQNSATIIYAQKGRGIQLNAGAKIAHGDILWFLHADTIPHKDSAEQILKIMNDKTIVGGGFAYNFGKVNFLLHFFSWYSNKKNKLFNRIYGDMGIFVRKDSFEQMNGFPEYHLMEDFEFSKQLKKLGAITIFPQQITTSPRDWYKEGFLKKILKDTYIKTAYRLHVDNKKLYNWYYGVK